MLIPETNWSGLLFFSRAVSAPGVVVTLSEHRIFMEKYTFFYIHSEITLCLSEISWNSATDVWIKRVQMMTDWLTDWLSFFSLWSSLLKAPLPLLKTHIEATKQQPEGQKQKLDLISGPLSQDKLRQLKRTFWQMKPVSSSQKRWTVRLQISRHL